MIEGIDHVAIAVDDLKSAIGVYDALLEREGPDAVEEVASEGVRVAFYGLGESRIELLECLTPSSPLARFLEKRGPGIHHICLRVRDIDALIPRLAATGLEFIGAAPRPGAEGCRVAFIHPRSTGGVLIELSEAPAA